MGAYDLRSTLPAVNEEDKRHPVTLYERITFWSQPGTLRLGRICNKPAGPVKDVARRLSSPRRRSRFLHAVCKYRRPPLYYHRIVKSIALREPKRRKIVRSRTCLIQSFYVTFELDFITFPYGQPTTIRKLALSQATRPQSRELDALGRRSLGKSKSREQTDCCQHWVLRLPLVPRYGAGKL